MSLKVGDTYEINGTLYVVTDVQTKPNADGSTTTLVTSKPK